MSCSAALACAAESPEVADVAEATDSIGVPDSTESTDSTDSTDSTNALDATSDSSDSGGNTGPIATSEEADATDSVDTTSDGVPVDLPPMPPLDPNEAIPPLDEEGCPGLYAQDLLPTFELTIDEEVWDDLVWEWDNGAELDDMGLDPNPNHPLAQFKYNDIVIEDAMIRLRGNPDFWDDDDKLQFHIDFNEVDKQGRFLGLRALAFDAATANRHMLRDRLALSIMRDMGIEAPCANNARLNVNGEYYGIFTSLERLNQNFLDRVFDDPTGDLWKRANWELETNENSSNDDRLEDLKDADSPEELEDYLDLEQALKVFAAEAILPDSDGMWAGGLNFYLYDDPISEKFLMLPWDLDNTFERFDDPPEGEYPVNPDPVVWEKWTTHGRPFYDLALEDADWFDYYIECIEDQFESSYDPDDLHDLIDTWTEQIEDSVLEDDNKPYSNAMYEEELEALHDYVQVRAEFLEEWLACWQNGGVADKWGYCN